MNRRIHGVFALLAVGTVVGLVMLWPSPRDLPPPSGAPTGVPTTGASPTRPTPTPPTAPPTGPDTTVTSCPPAQAPPARLSVLTFNIHGALGHGRLDLGAVAQAISASRADVVLLQEVDRYRHRTGVVDQAAWLGRTLGMHAAYGANKRRAPARPGLPRAAIGNAILSRFPLHDVSNTHLPNRPGMELRGLLHARIVVGGHPLSVYNTHLQHTSGSMRIEQAQAIREVVDRDPLPTVLGGDLNAEPDSVALEVLRRGGLEDGWPLVGRGEGLTVPAFVPHRRIDFLLHGEAVRPLEAAVLRSGISDHREVWARLQVERPATC